MMGRFAFPCSICTPDCAASPNEHPFFKNHEVGLPFTFALSKDTHQKMGIILVRRNKFDWIYPLPIKCVP